MDLTEVPATSQRPYRCYVRGPHLQSEGECVQTVGFKDGIAVVQVVQDNASDKIDSSRSIDLSKLQKIVVKIDPKTGKKYIDKDGRKIEILPQSKPISLRQADGRGLQVKMQMLPEKTSVIKSTASVVGEQHNNNNNNSGSVVLRGAPTGFNFNNVTLVPKLVPTGAKGQDGGVKYHVVQMNMKRPTVDKGLQTEEAQERREAETQTEPLYSDGRESPFTDLFFRFILDGEEGESAAPARKMIDPGMLKTKEEIHKFNFFNDMRNALNFDKSGNLPIHNCVMQNNLKAVQKCCVVLRAVKKSVNVPNKQNYAPLHLAVLYDVNAEIVKVLLHHDADVRAADPDGNTPLHLAIEHRRPAMLRMFVNAAVQAGYNLDVFNYEGFTPLIMACLNHSYDDAKLLLQNGANPNEKDMKSGRTALFHAAEGHDVNLVELLMHNKADTKIRNFFGTSPHDAMFELEEVPFKIKFSILGRDHQKIQNQKKRKLLVVGNGGETTATATATVTKKAKLTTTPVLRKVTHSDLIGRQKRK